MENAQVNMETKFKAAVCADISGAAAVFVKAYENTFGSTGPGCCPAALGTVLSLVADLTPEEILEVSEVLMTPGYQKQEPSNA